MKATLLVLVLGSISAFGQDDGAMMATQLFMQASQQASQQAIQDMQLASSTAQAMQQAVQINQQMIQNSQQMMQSMDSTSSPYSWPAVGRPVQPTFSVKSGKVKPGTKVRIKWRSSNYYSAIYYTTDGWTPTRASALYKGPISIDSTTQLQALAVSVNRSLSLITHAEYTVLGPVTPSPPLALSADGVLHAGTRLRLVTSSAINSKAAHVGDKLSILLDQDVKAGDVIIAPKGTPAAAVLTIAKPAARYSVPGDLVFEVHSIELQGKSIPLSGGETLEGAPTWKPTEAVIEPGMTLTAIVTADTPLKP